MTPSIADLIEGFENDLDCSNELGCTVILTTTQARQMLEALKSLQAERDEARSIANDAGAVLERQEADRDRLKAALASANDLANRRSGENIRLQTELTAAQETIGRLNEEIARIRKGAWCWPVGDGEHPYDWPIEWAENDLETSAAPCVVQFAWAGRLPDTWAVFTWSGDEDEGEWTCIEYESEAAARKALETEGAER